MWDSEKKKAYDRLQEIRQNLELVIEAKILDALALKFGVPMIDLSVESPDPEIAFLLNPKVIKKHKAMPVRLEGNELIVAMVDPLDDIAIEDIRLSLGYDVKQVVCSEKYLAIRFEKLFGEKFDG